MSEPETNPNHQATDRQPPIVIDLGKVKRKKAKALKKAEGPLMEEVDAVLDELNANGTRELEGKTLVPVVVLYEKKPKKKKNIFNLLD